MLTRGGARNESQTTKKTHQNAYDVFLELDLLEWNAVEVGLRWSMIEPHDGHGELGEGGLRLKGSSDTPATPSVRRTRGGNRWDEVFGSSPIRFLQPFYLAFLPPSPYRPGRKIGEIHRPSFATN